MTATRPNRHLPPAPLGWPLLPVPRDGSLDYPELDDSVRQMIRIILLTRPGELLLHPEFGVGLEHFLHEPEHVTTRRRIRRMRSRAGLERFEPRIALDRIEVEPDPERRRPAATRDRLSAAPHRRAGRRQPRRDPRGLSRCRSRASCSPTSTPRELAQELVRAHPGAHAGVDATRGPAIRAAR